MSPDLVLVAGPEDRGERLDRFLQAHLPGRSRAELQRLLTAGLVTVDPPPSRAPTPSLRVVPGARIGVRFPPPPPSSLEPWDTPLVVLLETPELAVIDKPPGLVVHPGAGRREGTLAHALLARYPEVASAGSGSRPGIVHRLDRATSGALVIARTHAAYLALVRQFASHAVDKRYLAIVAGKPSPAAGLIDAPIGRDVRDRKRFSTRAPRARPARSRYKLLETRGGFSLVEVAIETGRTHQIRVHMTSIGHPLVGDLVYGNAGRHLPAGARDLARVRGGAYLHAARLRFRHPASGEAVDVQSPVPSDFQRLWDALGG